MISVSLYEFENSRFVKYELFTKYLIHTQIYLILSINATAIYLLTSSTNFFFLIQAGHEYIQCSTLGWVWGGGGGVRGKGTAVPEDQTVAKGGESHPFFPTELHPVCSSNNILFSIVFRSF